MKTGEYIKEIKNAKSYGWNNAVQMIKAISELDKSVRQISKDLKEIPKQLKYFWQTLEELKEEKEKGK